MDEAKIRYKIVTCPNCGNKVTIQRNSIKCSKCGFVFTEYLDIKSDKEIKERNATRRNGNGVDMIDG